MSKLKTAFRLVRSDRDAFFATLLENLNFLFPDRLYLKLMFRCKMGYWLNLSNPKSYNEKIQWLKLYDRNPLYTKLVDKYAVKKWVADKIGDEYVIPTLGVWKSPKDIDFDKLPKQFVLKTTNGGGGDVVICRDKSKFDRAWAVKHLNQGLKKSIYNKLREWPYKNVPPRIIAEKYLEEDCGQLKDYKFFCFDGNVKFLEVDFDRFTEHHRNIYDENMSLLPFAIHYPTKLDVNLAKPLNFDKMLEIARLLSAELSHVRVDLYNVSGKIYFGEMTFYHGSGYRKMNPAEWDYKCGEFLNLRSK